MDNRILSPMIAPLLARGLGTDGYEITSAGLLEEGRFGKTPDPVAIACMNEAGFDITHHRSRWVGDLPLIQYAHIVCATTEALEAINHLIGEPAQSPGFIILSRGNGRTGIPFPRREEVNYHTYLRLLKAEVSMIARHIQE